LRRSTVFSTAVPTDGEVGADQLVPALHDVAVDDDGVHVAALGLEGHVAVGVEQRERERRSRRS
jgi:hypothetical protein